jgi:cytochrome b
MVIALWVFLAATVTTGLIVYAEEEGGGPLAPLYMQASDATSLVIKAGNDERKSKRKSAFEEIHEASANITLVLVILHVLGVLLASFVHHENLTRSMITGRKRLE